MGISLTGLFIACLIAILAFFFKRKEPAALYSSLSLVLEPMGKVVFAPLSRICFLIAFALLLFAFADPHTQKSVDLTPEKPEEGVELFLVLDHSGSMRTMTATGKSRLEVLKQVSRDFVKGRKGDLIGAISFARSAKVLSLPTLDHNHLIQEINSLSFVKDKTQDGTALGYALYKAASLLAATKESFPVKSQAIVLVTDGIQDPNPLDRGRRLRTIEPIEAAQFAADQGILFYLITVEPKLRTEAFQAHRKLMEEAARLTGGKFYMVSSVDELVQVMEEINTLEKSPLQQIQVAVRDIFFAKTFMLAASFLFFLGAGLETTWLKRVP